MNRFLEWWGKNRRVIGTPIGIFDLVLALLNWGVGNTMLAAFWFCLGVFILIDVWSE